MYVWLPLEKKVCLLHVVKSNALLRIAFLLFNPPWVVFFCVRTVTKTSYKKCRLKYWLTVTSPFSYSSCAMYWPVWWQNRKKDIKYTTSNMVAPLKSFQLTAAEVILKGSLSRITTWKMVDGTWTQAQTGSTQYWIRHAKVTYSLHCPMMHCVCLTKKEWDRTKQLPHSKSVA